MSLRITHTPVFISWSLCNNYHKLSGLNKRNILSYKPGGWTSEIKVLACLVPSDDYEGESVPGLSLSSWWLTANCWHFLACMQRRHHTNLCQPLPSSSHGIISVYMSMPKLPLFIRMPVFALRVFPTSV